MIRLLNARTKFITNLQWPDKTFMCWLYGNTLHIHEMQSTFPVVLSNSLTVVCRSLLLCHLNMLIIKILIHGLFLLGCKNHLSASWLSSVK